MGCLEGLQGEDYLVSPVEDLVFVNSPLQTVVLLVSIVDDSRKILGPGQDSRNFRY